MERDGHLKSLAERMKEKAELERIETEKIFKEQLQALSNNLQESSTNALRTMSGAITADITDATERLSQHYQTLSMAYGRAWIRTGLTALAMVLGMTAGGWALTRWAAYRLNTHRNELASVKTELRDQRQALDSVKGERTKAETWGLRFYEDKNGRFIIVPVGTTINATWTQGENQAIRLEK